MRIEVRGAPRQESSAIIAAPFSPVIIVGGLQSAAMIETRRRAAPVSLLKRRLPAWALPIEHVPLQWKKAPARTGEMSGPFP
jgi:hypothetical protein